ncbi:RagB/SusD family nutrient uptake outer membrane protein [Phocaeicola salanitronis]|uniref:RagB/SusD family nutrient uptake outer membrane protein n=1 Tax=Phocaeicola salanitronis TaxID=376805 RepID=UPI0025A47BFE|nr:RagB/SusD family nutrient uptake outer membrane protein [Phocaeicola salanitronis]MDM8305363.1 RagB/SusD family nutrient uptake outer membrane protein [Phocaeicola salanitronis]
MKHINKIYSIGLLGLLLAGNSACTNLLDDSYGQVVSENYAPKTEEEVSYLVNAAYIPWRETFLQWNGVVRSQELSADQDVIPARLGIGWVDGYIYKRWHEHTWTTEDDGVLQGWERTYNGINTCNRILSQIEEGVITVDEATREPLIAELKVLRASYYYILVDLYGNVPIVTDFKDSSLPKQSTRKEVFDFIIKEVTENIDLLSETPRGYYYGRFNKWAAHTLLAKMYLNAEIWSGTPQWQKCIDECDAVIDFANSSNEYALEANQKNVFVTNNENSKEIIFALPFDEIYVTGWNDFDFHMYTLAPENQDTYQFTERPWGGVCAIPQFIDTFHPDDLRLAQNYIQGQQYTASGEILQRSDGEGPLIYTNSVPSIDASDVDDGYRWGKFEYAQGITNRLSNDWPLFRYADILMMKAEALMRSGQPGAGELVTEVRKRAFEDINDAIVTDQQLEEGSCYDYGRRDENLETHESGEDIKYGRFLDELGWEFCQEGRRRQDMIRFGVFTTKSWFSHDKSNPNRNLYPIPNKIMLTNSNLTQNPQ